MIRRTAPLRPPAALAVSALALAVLCVVRRVPMADTLVYRAEGAAVMHGTDLYGFTVTEWALPATYPPFAAILFVPTTWLPLPALKLAFMAGNALLLALLIHHSARFARLPLPRPFLYVTVAVGLWLEPVFQTLLFGQINLVLICMILWDLNRPDSALGKGFALGVAAGVKLTPAVFIVHLLLTRQLRAAATASASFAGTVLLGALVLPSASLDFWTRHLFATGRVGKAWIVDNQSLQGLIARVLGDPAPGVLWLVPAALTAAYGLWLAARVHRRSPAWALLTTAFTALLVSPISWSHHWVWCVPLLALLLAEGRTRIALAVVAVFTARSFWILPHQGDLDLHLPWWQQPLASPYALLAVALLVCVALRFGRREYPSSRLIEQRAGSCSTATPDRSGAQ
ncbi:glycosyltransferase 87 family protein [Streptomyces sp. NPDC050418]|uniref:glycosyltransferase 87 family protein n=1 Tax=Streptomyces sp. NPDC050418 TaxID=3365612 RepID=UPI003793ADB0